MMMNFHNTKISRINLLNELVFKLCDLKISNLKPEAESQEYSAHRFQLNEQQILFRVAKITPTKTGQFVSIWKRNDRGITAPFDLMDQLDFLMIVTKTAIQLGVFIFPKKILLEKQIFSDERREGKRGIRVYAVWDETKSKQAQITQLWQSDYFLDLSNENGIDLNRAKDLLTTSNDLGNGSFKKIEVEILHSATLHSE